MKIRTSLHTPEASFLSRSSLRHFRSTQLGKFCPASMLQFYSSLRFGFRPLRFRFFLTRRWRCTAPAAIRLIAILAIGWLLEEVSSTSSLGA